MIACEESTVPDLLRRKRVRSSSRFFYPKPDTGSFGCWRRREGGAEPIHAMFCGKEDRRDHAPCVPAEIVGWRSASVHQRRFGGQVLDRRRTISLTQCTEFLEERIVGRVVQLGTGLTSL